MSTAVLIATCLPAGLGAPTVAAYWIRGHRPVRPAGSPGGLEPGVCAVRCAGYIALTAGVVGTVASVWTVVWVLLGVPVTAVGLLLSALVGVVAQDWAQARSPLARPGVSR